MDRDWGQLLFVTSVRSLSVFSLKKNAASLGNIKEINRKEKACILVMRAKAEGKLVTRFWFLLGQQGKLIYISNNISLPLCV